MRLPFPQSTRDTHMSFRTLRGVASAMTFLALAVTACGGTDESPAGLTTAPKPGSIPVYAGGATSRDIVPTGKGLDVADDTVPPPRTRYRIEYHNGALPSSTSVAYILRYGNW